MGKSAGTPNAPKGNDDLQGLRDQREQANRDGDVAKVADLDRQIRDAESQAQGTEQQ